MKTNIERRGFLARVYILISSIMVAAIIVFSADVYAAELQLISASDLVTPVDIMESGPNVSPASDQADVFIPEPDPPAFQPKIPAPHEFPDPPAKKCAYLTFDDGPSANTGKILDILDQYGVKGTFFVCNHKDYNYYYKEIVDRGHEIALHANSHEYKEVYASEDAFFRDLYTLQDKIFEIAGVRPYVTRFPGGSSNTVHRKHCRGLMDVLVDDLPSRGFIYHDWNVDTTDAEGSNRPVQTLINNVYTGMQGQNEIDVLMHDTGANKNTTVEALPKIIQMLIDNGYTILPITYDTKPIQHKKPTIYDAPVQTPIDSDVNNLPEVPVDAE